MTIKLIPMPVQHNTGAASSLQTEVDAAYLYQQIAQAEQDPGIAGIFVHLSEIEKGHAYAMQDALQKKGISIGLPPPSWRARTLDRIGRIFGYDYIIGVMMQTEKSITSATIVQKKAANLQVTGAESSHVRILQHLIQGRQGIAGEELSRIEGRHKTIGGNALRAAVLGANDGLVSNLSLVMGVAGATGGNQAILLAGSAGLLAGALSMALGEWISVKSSQELYENQMQQEMTELETNPEGERKEIALIYMAKGIPEDQSMQMASEIMKDTNKAHALLVREELGINAEELKGSAMEAAVSSFVLFAIGAILPVLPFFFLSGLSGIVVSAIASAGGLFLIGGAITLFTGKGLWFSGGRQVLFGLAAATITYGVGHLIGVSIAG